MAHRTQITLEDEMHRRAKMKAAEMGVSLAHYLRELLRRDLGGNDAAADVAQVFDLGESEGSDIARERDEALAGALAADRAGDRR